MAEPKDTTSFFRKVVKFVANPATEWAELDVPSDDTRESDYAKGELKAMIERKRRNDFVRKREFDMLRKVRREGLSGEQLAALGGSSRIDDSQPRISDQPVRQDAGVKAKIDEIEQQMVGDGYASTHRRAPEFYNAPTQPAPLEFGAGRPARRPAPVAAGRDVAPASGAASRIRRRRQKPRRRRSRCRRARGVAWRRFTSTAAGREFGKAFSAGNTEVTHDPDLDEAVIAFANADFEQCEQSLSTSPRSAATARSMRKPGSCSSISTAPPASSTSSKASLSTTRSSSAGRRRNGSRCPSWSPRRRARSGRAARASKARSAGSARTTSMPKASPSLASLALQMPLPWVFDFGALQTLDAEAAGACPSCSAAGCPGPRHALAVGERLFTVLQEAAPTGVRDADPAYWQLRLDALRMTNRPDQFDEAAIDYCVTYEVSPPSWEAARCIVRISGSNQGTTQPPLSVVSDVSTSFQESQLTDAPHMVEVGTVELSGQLIGDIGLTLKKMDSELGSAKIVNVSCARLIRVDFIAAGDLLNWVLARRSENRTVSFVDAHRMVALFFGAMGINEHATVKVRTI